MEWSFSSPLPHAAFWPGRAASVVLLLLVFALAPCRSAVLRAADPPAKPGAGKPTAGKAAAKPAKRAAPKPARPKPLEATQIEPAKLAMPKVVMSDAHAKACLVKVGDTLPAIQLNDLSGKRQPLSSLLGKRLTVVLFWQSNNSYAVEELGDLEPNISKQFGDAGVQVVAIDVRDPADVVAALVKRLDIAFPVLLDADGQTLAAVATSRLPRTYLLDDHGKILWFDTEYSASTRRDLRDAIRVVLNREG